MAFPKPFPVVKKLPCSKDYSDIEMPTFQRSDFSNATLVGMGSFGKVLRVTKGDGSICD